MLCLLILYTKRILPLARRLRIACFTGGRLHLCDLARELASLQHDVLFYSLVPPWRTKKFGLPDRCNRWLLPYVAPWLAIARAMRWTRLRHWADEKLAEALDRAGKRVLEPCDVFIGMSSMCNLVAPTARRRFGAKIWIERGSRYVLSQKAILDAIPGADTVPDYYVRRDLTDCQLADTVVVLSRHCEQSFLDYGFPAEKLFRNPLGVNLRMFMPTPAPPVNPPTVIMVGGWSMRKGCDVLIEAWRRLPGTRLVHVGPIIDCPLPSDSGFTHHAAVDQLRLEEYYAQAQVFALASREEGLATVIPRSSHVVCAWYARLEPGARIWEITSPIAIPSGSFPPTIRPPWLTPSNWLLLMPKRIPVCGIASVPHEILCPGRPTAADTIKGCRSGFAPKYRSNSASHGAGRSHGRHFLGDFQELRGIIAFSC